MKYLFLSMCFAHILGDFIFQTDGFCTHKRDEVFLGRYKFIHALIIFIASYVLSFSWNGWLLAFSIALVHWLIDAIKAAVENKKWKEKTALKDTRYVLWSFIVDQALHIASIYGICCLWRQYNTASEYELMKSPDIISVVMFVVFGLLATKPSNILIKLILEYFHVKTQGSTVSQTDTTKQHDGAHGSGDSNSEQTGENNNPLTDHGNFRSGALIGTLERLLMISFVLLEQYEAIGFLVGAKSILRFSETSKGGEKAEYVLAGTFLSVAIAMLLGYVITKRCWVF